MEYENGAILAWHWDCALELGYRGRREVYRSISRRTKVDEAVLLSRALLRGGGGMGTSHTSED